MLKAVCFDMDDTLLSLNLGAFCAVLVKEESGLLADIARRNPIATMTAWGGALLDLNSNAREEDDSRTNFAFFRDAIHARTGVPLDDPAVTDVFRYYEREVLPDRNDTMIAAHPREGAHAALAGVLERGLRIALLTNPCFTEDCIRCRMGWAEMEDVPFELVTSMENTTRCKPSPTYYLESLARLDLAPDEVLMVGNDPKRDFPTPDCGIATAYVGGGRAPSRALWSGSMEDFARDLDEVVERFETQAAARREDAPDA